MCEKNEKIPLNVGYEIVYVDLCIHRFLKVMNDNGFPTMASDCGHDKKPMVIEQRNGQTMIIVPRRIAKVMLKKFP